MARRRVLALLWLGLGVVSVTADPAPKPRPRAGPNPQDPAYEDDYNYDYDGDYGNYNEEDSYDAYGTGQYGKNIFSFAKKKKNKFNLSDPNTSPSVPDSPITPSAVEVDYNFDEVTDKCDKEACPPVACASPYIPLGKMT